MSNCDTVCHVCDDPKECIPIKMAGKKREEEEVA